MVNCNCSVANDQCQTRLTLGEQIKTQKKVIKQEQIYGIVSNLILVFSHVLTHITPRLTLNLSIM